MYILMNKDKEVGRFMLTHGIMGDTYQFIHSTDAPLPIGFQYIESWLENRKASKHNSHLRKIMKECGCDTAEGFIRITHAASINDTFWVKSENEDITWGQISFYRNPFDKTVSKLAFEGLGLYGAKFSSTVPELSTEGSFRKCWVRESNGEIFLYKRGSSGARNAGLEPYCEVLAAELAQKILGHDAVPYELVHLHGELASKCQLFTNEDHGYVPISRFNINQNSPDALIKFYAQIGSEDIFRKMIVLDSLTFNVDRHAGNHGVLIDNNTQIPIRMAPIFDLNMAMLPYIEKEDMLNIGNKLEEYGPRIGDDFTRIGQVAITPQIRSSLISMKEFSFSFRGDETFPEERIKFLEQLVNGQINALLSKEKLYTRDVFVPDHSNDEICIEKMYAESISKDDKIAEKIWENTDIQKYFSSYDIDNYEHSIILLLASNPRYEVYLNLATGDISLGYEGEKLDGVNILLNHPELMQASRIVQNAYNLKNIVTKQPKHDIEH